MANPFYVGAGAKINTGFLDTVIDVNPGVPISVGTGQNAWWDQVGKYLEIDSQEAKALSSVPGTFQLYGGLYQYVQFKDITNCAQGKLVFWDTSANIKAATTGFKRFVVTTVSSATNITQVAGVIINTNASSIAANNYVWIQVLGLANVAMKGSITDTTIGDIVFVDVTPSNTCDANTEASTTIRQYTKRVGVAYTAPASSTVSLVWLMPGGAIQQQY